MNLRTKLKCPFVTSVTIAKDQHLVSVNSEELLAHFCVKINKNPITCCCKSFQVFNVHSSVFSSNLLISFDFFPLSLFKAFTSSNGQAKITNAKILPAKEQLKC